MNMKQSCKALICAIEGELDGRHCTEEQAAAILDHALPSLTEALAQMEAERDTAIVQMQNIRTNRDRLNKQLGDAEFNLCIAHQQLAEAVGLLRYSQEIARLFDDEHTAEVGRFLTRHAKEEQQEAQGAQAGDERAAFEHEVRRQTKGLRFHPQFHRLDDTGLYEDATLQWSWVLWQARAALATQPAAKEGVVCVEVSGLTGTGKTAVAGEIEVAMLALGLEVQWVEGDREKRLNHADFAGELELYNPRIEIRERNIARPAVRGADHDQ